MARLTAEAANQVRTLTRHFLRLERPEAAKRLTQTVHQAQSSVDDPALRWFPAPRPHPQLARLGFRWIKLHRYWVAFRIERNGETLIHHVLDETTDIPARFGPDR